MSKTAFYCQNCGNHFPKWLGQCSACKEWNTLVEEVVYNPKKAPIGLSKNEASSKPEKINEIDNSNNPRIRIKDEELNRVLGGGIVPGSLILIGGEPGIGKSTLLLQISLALKNKVLYVSGEESQQQIKRRADRMQDSSDSCYILNETNVEAIIKHINSVQPELVIIDSIQTLQTDAIDSSPGSVSQIKESASHFLKYAKKTNLPILLVGHITKDGGIAGPKILEHMVDVVLHFEGDRNHIYRILRSKKNRFGSTAEIGIYEMLNNGLRQVKNPSELLLSNSKEPLSGNAIASTIEGIRPIMIEVQALVSSAVYGTPQRSTTGFNSKRLNMLLAVLEKKAGFKLGTKDVFLNITGGLKIQDPAIDLSMVCAILSSFFDFYIDHKICFIGEVGLSGEIRPVSRIEQRIKEVTKMGINTIYLSKYSKINDSEIQDYTLKKVGKLQEIIQHLFK